MKYGEIIFIVIFAGTSLLLLWLIKKPILWLCDKVYKWMEKKYGVSLKDE